MVLEKICFYRKRKLLDDWGGFLRCAILFFKFTIEHQDAFPTCGGRDVFKTIIKQRVSRY
jgi:hypothetical protein